MTRSAFLFVALMLASTAIAGPISKWDDRTPDHRYVSTANIHAVERCIIDSDGWAPPLVYRQHDRPDAVTIIYTHGDGKAAGRIDLTVVGGLLNVTAWGGPKAITMCAPPA
jgi:hypothetical protein